MKVAYYPGCSLTQLEKEFDLSTRASFEKLGIELIELDDWNCCGTVHMDTYAPNADILISGRNLAIAEAMDLDTVVAPCSGCYLNLQLARRTFEKRPELKDKMNRNLEDGLNLSKDIRVMHPLYTLIYDYGLDKIKEHVVRPLTDLKIASYSGCMLSRPKDIYDSPENPTGLDDLAKALGAEAVDYDMKAKCCGGPMATSNIKLASTMTGNILSSALKGGAEVVSLACPMCHTTLDGYQSISSRILKEKLDIPVLYFTQLLGLALGLEPKELGMNRHISSTKPLMAMI